jgi:hypothetical protein
LASNTDRQQDALNPWAWCGKGKRWLGAFFLVAIFDHFVDDFQVRQKCLAGPQATLGWRF